MSNSEKTSRAQHNTQAKFLTGNLMRHVTVMSLTSSVGIIAVFAVDLVDLFFLSLLGNASLAAAAGYASTLLFFANAISIGLSVAAGVLVARSLGENNSHDAREFATSVAMLGLVASTLVLAIIWLNLEVFLAQLGATAEVAALAIDYLNITLPAKLALMLAMVANAVLRAHGDANRAMLAILAGGATNAALDPLFIFTFNMGLEGAALASAVSNFVMLATCMIPAIKNHNGFARPNIGLVKRDAKAVSAIAVPALLTNLASPVGSALLMREMARFGTDAVAGMSIIGRVSPVAFAVVFALSGAVGPIIGQNFGANNQDRVRGTYLAAIKFVVIYILPVALILFLARHLIADAFSATGITRDLVLLFCGPIALTYVFNGFLFVSNASFNNLGHPIYSTWVNWGLNIIGIWLFAYIGAQFWQAEGVLIGPAIGAALFAAIAVFMSFRLLHIEGAGDRLKAFRHHHRVHVMTHPKR